MIKSLLLLSIILFLKLYYASCFDCSFVTSFEYCSRLQGCSWDPTLQCQGSFSPSCFTTKCYYIDSSSLEITSDGTPQYPLKTLSDGFKKLSNVNGTLIIINYQNNTVIQVTETVTLSSNITIMPLFDQQNYIIDLNQVPTAAASSYTSMITVSKQLKIIGATFQNISSSYARLRIFVLKAGTLIFDRVFIKSLNGPAATKNLWQIVYDSTMSSTKYSTFYYQNGNLIDTSARFIINGPSFWENATFTNFSNTVFLASSTSLPIWFKTCSFFGGSFLFVQAVGGNLTIQNLIFRDSVLNLFKFTAAKQILISNTTFDNITLFTLEFPFIWINAKPPSGDYLYSFQDTTFKNFLTPFPVIALKLGDLELIRVSMENIKKGVFETSSIKSAGLFGSNLIGICCTSYEANLSVKSSSFTKINSTCLGVRSSKLSITSSVFDNSALKPNFALSQDSYDELDESSGVTWIKIEGVSPSMLDGDKIILLENTFSSNNLPPLYGGVLSFKGAEPAKLIAVSNKFITNYAVYGGVFHLKGPALSLQLKNNTFFNNSAFNGGAMYKTSPANDIFKTTNSSISTENDMFINNSALGNGGALFLNQESIRADSTRFISNEAQNGGAIYFINLDESSQDQYGLLSNVIFKENVASNVGGALKLFFDYSQLKQDLSKPSLFENNQDIEKNSIHTSRPSYYQFLFYEILKVEYVSIPKGAKNILDWLNDPQNAKLGRTVDATQQISDGSSLLKINQKSGQAMSQIMLIQIIDDKNKLANYINGERIRIEITEFENNISDKTPDFYYNADYFLVDQGQILVSNGFKLEGEPTTKALLNLKSESAPNSFLKDADLLMNQNIEIDFVNCSVGEIFNQRTRTCDPCQENSYSLGDPYTTEQCSVCVPNAQCLGGAMIAPDPGFWRFNNQTTHIFQSKMPSASQGGFDSETGKYSPQGICVPPYTGKKCDECVQGYATLGSRKGCFSCSNSFYYLISFSFLFIQLAAIFYLFTAYLMETPFAGKIQPSGQNKKSMVVPLIKILIAFLQLSSILFELRIGFPDVAYDVIWGVIKIIPLGKDGLLVDCFLKMILQDEKHLNLAKIIITSLIQPLLFWILLIWVSQVYFFLKRKSLKPKLSMKTMNGVLFMVIGYVLQPFILQRFFEIFKCQNFTPDLKESHYFMQESPNMKCYSYDHWMWSILPGSISVLVWFVALPYISLTQLKNSPWGNFTCGDFKPKKFYWEILIFLKKGLLMFIVNVFSAYSTGFQIFFILTFLYLFFLLQWKRSPYKDPRLNFAESFSLLSSLSTVVLLFISSYSQQNNEYPKVSYFISALIFILILIFYLQILSILKSSWGLSFNKKQQSLTPLNENIKSSQVQQHNSMKGFCTEEKPISLFGNTQNKVGNQKAAFVRELPDSPLFKFITSLDTQRSENSHLLSSPRTLGDRNSALLRNSLKTKDHHS